MDPIDWTVQSIGSISFFEVANRGRKPVKASLRLPGETPYYGANNSKTMLKGIRMMASLC